MARRVTKRENMLGNQVGFQRAEDSMRCFLKISGTCSSPFILQRCL